jgi:hypothetical protein
MRIQSLIYKLIRFIMKHYLSILNTTILSGARRSPGIPWVASVIVRDNKPRYIEITTIDDVDTVWTPSNGSFRAVNRTILSVELIAPKTVLLELNEPYYHGDDITFSYKYPKDNYLRNLLGAKYGDIKNQVVSNAIDLNIEANTLSTTEISVSADFNISNVDRFDWEVSDLGVVWTPIGSSIVPNFTHTGRTPGTGYYYRVRTLKGVTFSSYSNSAYDIAATVMATVGSGGNYGVLVDAFTAVNEGNLTGRIILKLLSSEVLVGTAPIMYQNGYQGTAVYDSVAIYPAVDGIILDALLDYSLKLDKADNVTIDGRVGRIGAPSLIITNTDDTQAIGIIQLLSTINFRIRWCNLQPIPTQQTSLSIEVNDVGCIGTIIERNNFTGGTQNCISIVGTTGINHQGIIIRHNDFVNPISTSTGTSRSIFLAANAQDTIISNNNFYQTTPMISGSTVDWYAIRCVSSVVFNTTIDGNCIGGSARYAGGTPWTNPTGPLLGFNGMLVRESTGISIITNNIIRNISLTNQPATRTLIGIDASSDNAAGSVQIDYNTIGAHVGTGSISVTSGGSTVCAGISISNIGNHLCRYNKVGSITTNIAGATTSHSIRGISRGGASGTTSIIGNLIGSLVTQDSLNAAATSTTGIQTVQGIVQSSTTGQSTITSNYICNLSNNSRSTSASTLLYGVSCTSGIHDIQSNTIYGLRGYGTKTSTIGINSAGTASAKTITGNIIRDLIQVNTSYSGNIYGIQYVAPSSGTNIVSRNFISNFIINNPDPSHIGLICGIKSNQGNTTFHNNIIILGEDSYATIYALYDAQGAGSLKFYYNTIVVNGSAVVDDQSHSSVCLWLNSIGTLRDVRNNILINNRLTPGVPLSDMAINHNYADGAALVVGYNVYRGTSFSGFLGVLNNQTYTTVPIVSGKDVGSVTTDPAFVNEYGTVASDFKPTVALLGDDTTGITIDYDNVVRVAPVTMGAYEI